MSDEQGTTFGRRPGRDAERVVAAEQLQQLAYMRQTMSDFVAQLAGRLFNKTLQVGTAKFDADGRVALSFGIAAGSIEVTPLTNNDVTVCSRGPEDGAPQVGIGVSVVRGSTGIAQTIPVDSHQITLYGTAGERVSYAVFAGAVNPTS